MATPVTYKGNGIIQVMSTDEFEGLAQAVLEYMAANDGPGGIYASNVGYPERTLIGTFTDTAYAGNIGDGDLNIVTTLYPLFQDLTAPTDDDPPVPLYYGGQQKPLQVMTNQQFDAMADDILQYCVLEEGPHSYVLAATAPLDGGTWTSLGELVDDKSGNTSTSAFLFKKLEAGAYELNKPLKILESSTIQQFTDEDVELISKRVRQRIIDTGVGKYVLQASAPSTGTWVAKGTISNTIASDATVIFDAGFESDISYDSGPTIVPYTAYTILAQYEAETYNSQTIENYTRGKHYEQELTFAVFSVDAPDIPYTGPGVGVYASVIYVGAATAYDTGGSDFYQGILDSYLGPGENPQYYLQGLGWDIFNAFTYYVTSYTTTGYIKGPDVLYYTGSQVDYIGPALAYTSTNIIANEAIENYVSGTNLYEGIGLYNPSGYTGNIYDGGIDVPFVVNYQGAGEVTEYTIENVYTGEFGNFGALIYTINDDFYENVTDQFLTVYTNLDKILYGGPGYLTYTNDITEYSASYVAAYDTFNQVYQSETYTGVGEYVLGYVSVYTDSLIFVETLSVTYVGPTGGTVLLVPNYVSVPGTYILGQQIDIYTSYNLLNYEGGDLQIGGPASFTNIIVAGSYAGTALYTTGITYTSDSVLIYIAPGARYYTKDEYEGSDTVFTGTADYQITIENLTDQFYTTIYALSGYQSEVLADYNEFAAIALFTDAPTYTGLIYGQGAAYAGSVVDIFSIGTLAYYAGPTGTYIITKIGYTGDDPAGRQYVTGYEVITRYDISYYNNYLQDRIYSGVLRYTDDTSLQYVGPGGTFTIGVYTVNDFYAGLASYTRDGSFYDSVAIAATYVLSPTLNYLGIVNDLSYYEARYSIEYTTDLVVYIQGLDTINIYTRDDVYTDDTSPQYLGPGSRIFTIGVYTVENYYGELYTRNIWLGNKLYLSYVGVGYYESLEMYTNIQFVLDQTVLFGTGYISGHGLYTGGPGNEAAYISATETVFVSGDEPVIYTGALIYYTQTTYYASYTIDGVNDFYAGYVVENAEYTVLPDPDNLDFGYVSTSYGVTIPYTADNPLYTGSYTQSVFYEEDYFNTVYQSFTVISYTLRSNTFYVGGGTVNFSASYLGEAPLPLGGLRYLGSIYVRETYTGYSGDVGYNLYTSGGLFYDGPNEFAGANTNYQSDNIYYVASDFYTLTTRALYSGVGEIGYISETNYIADYTKEIVGSGEVTLETLTLWRRVA